MSKEMNLKELVLIINTLKSESLKSYKDLESINTGSKYKSKDEILSLVCGQSRMARRINSVLHDCLDWILEGKSIDDFYNHKVQNATRTNQCKQDSLDSMQEIEWLTELIVNFNTSEDDSKQC